MPDLPALKKFIEGLGGERLFIAGVNGVSSMVETQTNLLRICFVQYAQNANDEESKSRFLEALFAAHAVSVITDKELNYCEDLVG